MVYHFEPDDGLRLVQQSGVAATAFTGSRHTGLALKAAAALSQELFASCTLGTGHYCTNPCLVVVPAGQLGESFLAEAAASFGNAAPGTMLGQMLPTSLAGTLEVLQKAGAVLVVGGQPGTGPGYHFQNTLLRVSGREFLANHAALQTEAFGPASLVVLAADDAELMRIAQRLDGNLTGSIYSDTLGTQRPSNNSDNRTRHVSRGVFARRQRIINCWRNRALDSAPLRATLRLP